MDNLAKAVELRLGGATQQEIADALGLSRQRALQLLDEALASGRFTVKVQVGVASSTLDRKLLAAYLRQALNAAGVELD